MTLIYFILVLGITVFIHELGHFIFAKKAGIYVYEFSIGMGPKIFSKKRENDETVYSLRLFPIGGFVQMAGEEVDIDENIPVEKRMQSKTWMQRLTTILAGVTFNFILAIVILFGIGLFYGSPVMTPVIESKDENYPIYKTNIQSGDEILSINGKKTDTQDMLLLHLQVLQGEKVTLEVKHEDGKKEKVTLKPKEEKIDGEKVYKYGFSLKSESEKGFIAAIKYAFKKTYTLLKQMVFIVTYLFTGKLKLNSLSGPIGIYTIVGESAKAGFVNLVYLIAYLCINVGFINLLPFPAFDGGRALFLLIEKIKGSPVSVKVENTIHNVGFVLLMILMVFITYNDIIRIFFK